MTVYLPDIGRLLPVYVADRYEGFDARPYPELSDEELADYTDANVAAVRSVEASVRTSRWPTTRSWGRPFWPARSLAGEGAVRGQGARQRAGVHDPGRPESATCRYAREGLRLARGVLVGSRHSAEPLWEVLPTTPRCPGRPGSGPREWTPTASGRRRTRRPGSRRSPRGSRPAARPLGRRGGRRRRRCGGTTPGATASSPSSASSSSRRGSTCCSRPGRSSSTRSRTRACGGRLRTFRDALGRLLAAMGSGDFDGAARGGRARTRARGRAAGPAAPPAGLPRRAGRRRAGSRRARGGRARALHRPLGHGTSPSPRRRRGAGRAEHLPRGVRHGGGRGRRLRRAAAAAHHSGLAEVAVTLAPTCWTLAAAAAGLHSGARRGRGHRGQARSCGCELEPAERARAGSRWRPGARRYGGRAWPRGSWRRPWAGSSGFPSRPLEGIMFPHREPARGEVGRPRAPRYALGVVAAALGARPLTACGATSPTSRTARPCSCSGAEAATCWSALARRGRRAPPSTRPSRPRRRRPGSGHRRGHRLEAGGVPARHEHHAAPTS